MNARPTRRGALITIAAASAAAPAALSAQESPYKPQAFSKERFDLITALVEMIIPESDTPGAAAAGVDRYVDEEAAEQPDLKRKLSAGLARLEADGFAAMSEPARVALLTDYSKAEDSRGEFLTLLKNLTVDGYYSTEIGLVQELGYQGNTFLPEFPGCTDEDHL